jgi:hypothetical protein
MTHFYIYTVVNVLVNYAGLTILTNYLTCPLSSHFYCANVTAIMRVANFVYYRSAAIRNHKIYASKNNCTIKNGLVIVHPALRIDHAINGLPSKEPPIPSQLLNLFSCTGSQYNSVSLLRR